jgi:hypothetical protein
MQLTCSRWLIGAELLRWMPEVHASGPNGSRAALGGGGIIGTNVGYLAYASNGWELGPFFSAELGLSYMTFSAPGDPVLPAGIFKSQGRVDFPLHFGLRITKVLDTSSRSRFGYAEAGRQGMGPVLGLELGLVFTPGGPWFDDSQGVGNPGKDSALPGLGSTGPFVRLVLGWGVWHAGSGPWQDEKPEVRAEGAADSPKGREQDERRALR